MEVHLLCRWVWVWLRTRDISRMQYSTASPVGSCAPTAQVERRGEIRVTATACDSHRGLRAADATLQYPIHDHDFSFPLGEALLWPVGCGRRATVAVSGWQLAVDTWGRQGG